MSDSFVVPYGLSDPKPSLYKPTVKVEDLGLYKPKFKELI